MTELLLELECEKCEKKLYCKDSSYLTESHVIPIIVDGMETGFTICTGQFKEVQRWQKHLPDRPVGNRFVIRNGELIKITNGERIPEEEPLFLMRGRDHLALLTLRDYQLRCVADMCNDYILGLLDETIQQFKDFKEKFPERMKQPGVTRGR